MSCPKNRANSKCTVRSKKKRIKQIANSSQTQRLYIGNLSDYTTEVDLYELFGLCSTKYLKQNYSVKMSTNSNTGKKEIFCLCRCT